MLKREVRCSRCPRVEHVDVSMEEILAEAKAAEAAKKKPEEEPKKKAPAELRIRLGDKTLAEFDVLCSTCRDIVTTHIDHIARVSKHKSSKRGGTDAS